MATNALFTPNRAAVFALPLVAERAVFPLFAKVVVALAIATL